jgi:hypothetical protein
MGQCTEFPKWDRSQVGAPRGRGYVGRLDLLFGFLSSKGSQFD